MAGIFKGPWSKCLLVDITSSWIFLC